MKKHYSNVAETMKEQLGKNNEECYAEQLFHPNINAILLLN